MPAKTPVMDNTTAGYTVPMIPSVRGGVNAVNADLITNGTHKANGNDLKWQNYYFSDIDDTDTWTSNIPNIFAVAWQGDQVDTDRVAATVTTAATGIVTFGAENANSKGWLWVMRGQ
ncbi:unnamed protein product [marine sediment metagenome]|uniref:Tail fiber protein n=1 Tax=marine sediment metagenome TaxID=412755 RepID=X0WNF6_9ZZZZ